MEREVCRRIFVFFFLRNFFLAATAAYFGYCRMLHRLQTLITQNQNKEIKKFKKIQNMKISGVFIKMAGWGQGRCYKMIEQLPKLSLPKLMEEDVKNKKKK